MGVIWGEVLAISVPSPVFGTIKKKNYMGVAKKMVSSSDNVYHKNSNNYQIILFFFFLLVVYFLIKKFYKIRSYS